MMTIILNDNAITIDENFNVLQLLQKVKSPINGIAVAINNEIVPQHTWGSVQLKPDDKLLIIQATQGG